MGCFPRTRGDGPQNIITRWGWEQFPPHTRGWTPVHAFLADNPAVSPAHAGAVLRDADPSLHFHRIRLGVDPATTRQSQPPLPDTEVNGAGVELPVQDLVQVSPD